MIVWSLGFREVDYSVAVLYAEKAGLGLQLTVFYANSLPTTTLTIALRMIVFDAAILVVKRPGVELLFG